MFNKTIICFSFLVSVFMGVYPSHGSASLFDEDQSHRNESLLNLLSYTMHYKGYEEDYEIFANSYNEEQRALGGKYSTIDLSASIVNQEIADRYAQGIVAVMSNQCTLNSFLHTLLRDRLERLKTRSAAKDEMFKIIAEARMNPEKFQNVLYSRVAYTHPSMIEKHYADDPVMRRQAAGDTTFYQFVNSLIAGLYKIAQPEELSENTRLLIRASPCLHGLLRGETDDLGHPDEAIYQDASDQAGKLFDLDLYETHLLKSELVDMPLLGYAKGQSIKIYMTQYERSQVDETYYYMGIAELPYPKWLVPRVVAVSAPSCSTSLSGVTSTSSKQRVLAEHTGKNSPKQKRISQQNIPIPLDTTSPEAGKKTQESPHLEFVKSAPYADSESMHGIESEEADKIESAPASGGESISCENSDSIAIDQVTEIDSIAIDQVTEIEALDLVIEGMSGLKMSEVSDDLPSVAPKTKVKEKKTLSLASSSSDSSRLPPRGMRLFHPHTIHPFKTLKQSFEDLGGKHKATLVSLFHHQQYKTVTSKQIDALWRHINGHNSIKESTRSSHKALLDATGRVVIGTFSHGGSMTYTHKTIEYPREGFRMIGFGLEQEFLDFITHRSKKNKKSFIDRVH